MASEGTLLWWLQLRSPWHLRPLASVVFGGLGLDCLGGLGLDCFGGFGGLSGHSLGGFGGLGFGGFNGLGFGGFSGLSFGGFSSLGFGVADSSLRGWSRDQSRFSCSFSLAFQKKSPAARA